MKFGATKKRYDNKFFSTPLFCCCFWIRDPGSGIRDPGSEIRDPGWAIIRIRDPGWVKIRIRDKHPGSATLILTKTKF